MKIAIITGGSRGLGKAMALALAQKGIGSIITYHSKKNEANEVVLEIEKMGVTSAALQLDAEINLIFSSIMLVLVFMQVLMKPQKNNLIC
jgi:NAD(P)-dependent dehydrogenase (short-subunit alcohol dehydrogenase family)